ncbi:MAG: heavy-metal-associated domain-containing protein [Thermodesulfobacteriota bacterium]
MPAHSGEIKSVTLRIGGMTCRLCTTAVKKSLSGVEGVKGAKVSFKGKEAYVEYDEAETDLKEMLRAVEKAGYKAQEIKGD